MHQLACSCCCCWWGHVWALPALSCMTLHQNCLLRSMIELKSLCCKLVLPGSILSLFQQHAREECNEGTKQTKLIAFMCLQPLPRCLQLSV
jgi:hypothetical protein